MRPMALVSVVLPAFNAEHFLGGAIESVLSQSLSDLELVIVDDGSTDATADVISRYRDPRIKLVSFSANRGLVQALNVGVGEAQSELIARLDADDAAGVDRLKRQVGLFEADPGLGLVGSGWRWTDDDRAHDGRAAIPRSIHHAAIRLGLHFANQFNHSSMMFRRERWIDADGYREDEWPAEDYGLWVRMSAKTRVANIPEPLILARSLDSGISGGNREAQYMATQEIAAKALSTLLGRRIMPEMRTQFLTVDCPSCDAFAKSERLLLDAMHAIAKECDRREISRKGLARSAAELLHDSQYRARHGERCIRPLVSLPLREPSVAAQLLAARARWWFRRHV
jgi:hypothetical protein